MFSSVIFHDHARKRGIKPILGCEVYVAPGSRLTKSGNPGETANHLVLLAENAEGYHNLIKLVSAGYTDGFYYKPRIDKALLAQHSKGLIGLSSCLKGEVAEGLSRQQEKRAIEAAGAYRDILGPNNFFLEMQWHGIEDQRVVNSGLPAIARDLKLPLVCTNDVHYLRAGDAHPHDVLLCIGTGKAFSDPKRLRYDAKQFFLKTPRGNGGRLQGLSGGAGQHRPHRRALRRHHRRGRELPAELRRPGAIHARRLLRARDARGVQRAAVAAQAAGVGRHAAPHGRRVRAPAVVRDRDDQADEVPRVLPDRLGLHPLRARAGHPGRSGPRIGRRQPGRVLPPHHRRRSDRLRPDLRAVPQPRARVAPRHRHRLLRAPARRSDRVRHPQVRPRERGPDHHLRDDEGEGGGARRRPRAGDAVRRRQQGREADPADARHDARQGARGEPGAEGARAERPEGQGAAERREAPRGHDPARIGARRRRRHRPQGDHRVRAALQRAHATKSRRSGR